MGVTHCQFFSDRLYNFNNTFRPDPTMDPAQVTLLRSVCPRIFPGLGGTVSLDQGTRFIFDNSFYQELQQNRGILQMDQELSRDPTTAALVSQLAAPDSNFTTIFGQAMVKLGNVGVLTGARGEIRKICSQIN
jgi:peroxidase